MDTLNKLLCFKIGGSVLTDKNIPYTAKPATIRNIATGLKKIKLPLFIAHGSGSFGHTSAQKYGGKNGYESTLGIAKVARDAEEINRIVMDIFIQEGLPAISFSPRSFFLAEKGELQKSFLDPLLQALNQGLIPVVYGDVIWDSSQKSTIFSGETTLNIVCRFLKKEGKNIAKVIQLCDVDGVLDSNKKVIPEITNENWDKIKGYIKKSEVADVTGGMLHKVEDALSLAQDGIETWIINGNTLPRISSFKEKLTKGTIVR